MIKRNIDALTVRNTEELQWGVAELVHWCKTYIEPNLQHYRIVFNLTGGFKVVQGILNTLGMFSADELVYAFEGQSELIHIPRLAVRRMQKAWYANISRSCAECSWTR